MNESAKSNGGVYASTDARRAGTGRTKSRPYPRSKRAPTFRGSSQGRANSRTTALAWTGAHPGTLLLAWIAVVAGVRVGMALTYEGYLGVDTGAYLLGVNEVWGGEPTKTSFARPPLAPGFLMVPFLWAFPGYIGANLYAAVFSLSILPGFYLLAQRVLGKQWGAVATVGLTLDWPLGEMFVTGVVPITGFGMLALVLWGMMGEQKRHLTAIALGVPLVAFTNQTTLGIAFVTIPLAWLVLPRQRRNLIALTVGALLALTALPWYINVLPGADRVSYPGPLVYLNPWWSSQWIQAAGGLAVGALVWRKTGNIRLKVVALLLIVHSVLNVFLSYDEAFMNVFYRSSYWMAVPFWICAAYLLRYAWRRWELRTVHPSLIVSTAALFVAVMAYGVQDQFYGQAYYSNLAGPDVLAALDSIDIDDVTRIGTNAESRGFYLAAITRKPVAWVQSALPADSYIEQERLARCSIGWAQDCESNDYVSHWIIDTRHTQQIAILVDGAPDPLNPWADFGGLAPWLTKTFEQGTVQVWTHARQP